MIVKRPASLEKALKINHTIGMEETLNDEIGLGGRTCGMQIFLVVRLVFFGPEVNVIGG